MPTCVYNGSRDVLGGDYRFAVFDMRGSGGWVFGDLEQRFSLTDSIRSFSFSLFLLL